MRLHKMYLSIGTILFIVTTAMILFTVTRKEKNEPWFNVIVMTPQTDTCKGNAMLARMEGNYMVMYILRDQMGCFVNIGSIDKTAFTKDGKPYFQ